MDDAVLPSPAPQAPSVTPSTGSDLPPPEAPSTVQKFIIVKGIAAPLHIENVRHRHDPTKTIPEDTETGPVLRTRCSLPCGKTHTLAKIGFHTEPRTLYTLEDSSLHGEKLWLRKLSRTRSVESCKCFLS